MHYNASDHQSQSEREDYVFWDLPSTLISSEVAKKSKQISTEKRKLVTTKTPPATPISGRKRWRLCRLNVSTYRAIEEIQLIQIFGRYPWGGRREADIRSRI